MTSRWEDIHWQRINISVSKLRYKIFQAKKRDNTKLIRKLQGIMLRSEANIMLSIRRITSH